MRYGYCSIFNGDHTMTAMNELNPSSIGTISKMDSSELDKLPFGAIRLDANGKILSYNAHEAQLTGRMPERVIGRNFFTDVAPCTNVKEFAGRFREGVLDGNIHAVFPYTFDFEMEKRNVSVTLFHSKETESSWVFVQEDA